MKKSYIDNEEEKINDDNIEQFIVKPIPVLTYRERKVLEYAAQGLGNTTIAQKLYISSHTVKAHVASALKKLSAINRTQAVYLAAKYHIID